MQEALENGLIYTRNAADVGVIMAFETQCQMEKALAAADEILNTPTKDQD